jgi:hypothetical protein
MSAFSKWIPWVEYLPFYFLLAIELWKNQNQKQANKDFSIEG